MYAWRDKGHKALCPLSARGVARCVEKAATGGMGG
jgi:hypothetical protein